MVMLEVSVSVGVPDMVLEDSVRPEGRPVALYEVGLSDAVMVYVNDWFCVAEAVSDDVMDGVVQEGVDVVGVMYAPPVPHIVTGMMEARTLVQGLPVSVLKRCPVRQPVVDDVLGDVVDEMLGDETRDDVKGDRDIGDCGSDDVVALSIFLFNMAIVEGPTYPVPLMRLLGVNMVDLLISWSFMTAL